MPPIVSLIVLVLLPVLVRLTGGWLFRRECPTARWEPARTLEEGFCCLSPHPRFDALVRGLEAVREEGLARAVGLANRLGRAERDVVALAASSATPATLALRVPSQSTAVGALDGAVQSLGADWGAQAVVRRGSQATTLVAAFPDAGKLLAWRDGPGEELLRDVGPETWAEEVRVSGAVEIAGGIENGAAGEPIVHLAPHRPPLLYKMAVVVTLALYPVLVVIGFPIGAAVVAAGAHATLGSIVTISVAVPIVGLLGAPLVATLFARWLSDGDSGECDCCPTRIRRFCHVGIMTCCE